MLNIVNAQNPRQSI